MMIKVQSMRHESLNRRPILLLATSFTAVSQMAISSHMMLILSSLLHLPLIMKNGRHPPLLPRRKRLLLVHPPLRDLLHLFKSPLLQNPIVVTRTAIKTLCPSVLQHLAVLLSHSHGLYVGTKIWLPLRRCLHLREERDGTTAEGKFNIFTTKISLTSISVINCGLMTDLTELLLLGRSSHPIWMSIQTLARVG